MYQDSISHSNNMTADFALRLTCQIPRTEYFKPYNVADVNIDVDPEAL